MEDKINIAEILRDMPKGTKLYSPLFGKCEYIGVDNIIYPINIRTHNTTDTRYEALTEYGCYFSDFEDTDTVLFPSAKMRDWNKFFKRGDIVYNPHSQMYAVFECWMNDDYTEFNTTINYYKDHTFGEWEVCDTECFVKANDEQKTLFIAAAEKCYGGKYNPETLHVEPVKVIEPKCSFKPFDKVLVRYGNGIWGATFFSRYDNKSAWAYVGVDCINWEQCIPYEGNEHLLGTDKSPE